MLIALLPHAAFADPPPPYEYIISYKLGRGFPLCDAVFGQLVSPRNELYLRYHAGAPVTDAGKGESDGIFFLTSDALLTLPAWHWDNGNGETVLDLDGNSHREKIYSTHTVAGDFPHLSMDDNSELAASLASLQGSYIVIFDLKPYIIARQFGRLEVYQLWKSNAPLETRLCEFVTSAPVEGVDVQTRDITLPLQAVNYH